MYFIINEHINVLFLFIITKLMVSLKIYDILGSGKHGVSRVLQTNSRTGPGESGY